MEGRSKVAPKGAKIVAAPERFRDAIESGVPIEQGYTVRRVKLDLPPRTFGAEEPSGHAPDSGPPACPSGTSSDR